MFVRCIRFGIETTFGTADVTCVTGGAFVVEVIFEGTFRGVFATTACSKEGVEGIGFFTRGHVFHTLDG